MYCFLAKSNHYYNCKFFNFIKFLNYDNIFISAMLNFHSLIINIYKALTFYPLSGARGLFSKRLANAPPGFFASLSVVVVLLLDAEVSKSAFPLPTLLDISANSLFIPGRVLLPVACVDSLVGEVLIGSFSTTCGFGSAMPLLKVVGLVPVVLGSGGWSY